MSKEHKAWSEGCQHWRAALKAWIDGELEPSRAREVESHLSSCPDCQSIAEDFRRLTSILRQAIEAGPLQSSKTLAAQAMADARFVAREEARTVRTLQRVALGAAALLLISLGFMWGSPRIDDTDQSLGLSDGLDGVLELAINDSSEDF